MTKDSSQMNSSVSDICQLNEMTRSLERSESRRVGTGLTQARKNVARRLGVSHNTIENFRSLRTKIVPHWLMNKVRAELASVLQMEAQNLEHEIQLHRQIGSDYRDHALASAEAQLAETRSILRGEKR